MLVNLLSSRRTSPGGPAARRRAGGGCRRRLAAVALAFSLFLASIGGSGTPATAIPLNESSTHTRYLADKSIWSYGLTVGKSGKVWSKYYHPGAIHRSTACSSVDCAYSIGIDFERGKWWTLPHETAYAETQRTERGNRAYYDAW